MPEQAGSDWAATEQRYSGLSFWFFQTYVSHVYDIKPIPLQPIDATQYGRLEVIVTGASSEIATPVQAQLPAAPAKEQGR